MPFVTQEWYNNLSGLVDGCGFRMKMLELALKRREEEIKALRATQQSNVQVSKKPTAVAPKPTAVAPKPTVVVPKPTVVVPKPTVVALKRSKLATTSTVQKTHNRRRMGKNFMRRTRESNEKIDDWFSRRMLEKKI